MDEYILHAVKWFVWKDDGRVNEFFYWGILRYNDAEISVSLGSKLPLLTKCSITFDFNDFAFRVYKHKTWEMIGTIPAHECFPVLDSHFRLNGGF